VELEFLVLLGCRLRPFGALSAAGERRAARAAAAFHAGIGRRILACGGKIWSHVRETDALCAALSRAGVPEDALEREGLSRSTRQNARYAAKLLLPRGVRSIGLVTCDWHMPRALRCFEGAGFDPMPLPAIAPRLRGLRGLERAVRERLSFAVDRVVTCNFTSV